MNTAAQNSPGQPSAADPLLAEAIALTLHDYREALAAIAAEPAAGEARVQAGRIRAEIQSDPRLAPLVEARPEFVDWAVAKAAADRAKQVPEVSAVDVTDALDEPRLTLVGYLVGALSRYGPELRGYVRIPLQAVLGDPRPWAGGAGQFTRAAADDLYAAHQFGIDVDKAAQDLGIKPFDVLAAVRRARLNLLDDQAWRTAPDSPAQRERFQRVFEQALAARESAGGGAQPAEARAALAGEPCPPRVATQACAPCGCSVSGIDPDQPPLPTEMAWAGQADPCQSVAYLRSLVRMYTIGETGQLFPAGERLADRWAEATNWCWPDVRTEQETDAMACRQSFDDALYCLRRRNAEPGSVYVTRAGLYQAQLETPGLQQAWADFVTQVDAYLASPRTGAGRDASYRCLGIYTAAEALRRVAAAQLTGLARMQIRELACSFQAVWRLFTDPRVIQIIDPIVAGLTPGLDSLADDRQAAVVFGVAQQLLGSDATGLYQAWDKAILLDQVFSWVQLGRSWSPASDCEDDEVFVELLGVMSALIPGPGSTPLTTASSLAPAV